MGPGAIPKQDGLGRREQKLSTKSALQASEGGAARADIRFRQDQLEHHGYVWRAEYPFASV